MEWIAYCTVCGELGRAPNGQMMEAKARLHRRDTGHMTIIGCEPSIIVSGEMVEVPTGEREKHYWEVTNMIRGEIMQSGTPLLTIQSAVVDAKHTMDTDFRHFGDDHLVIKVFDKNPDERAGLTYEPEHTESYWIEGVGRKVVDYLSSSQLSRPFPQTYGDWVSLAEDIKAKYADDPVGRASVNYNLNIIAREGKTVPMEEEADIDEAKRWLVEIAGELGIR